jgi:hypothetical protein
MNTLLQERIARLGATQMPLMMAEGGEVDPIDPTSPDSETVSDIAMAAEMPQDPNADLREMMSALMQQADNAEDPLEARVARGFAESAEIASQAPLADMAVQLSQAGRGTDTQLAHLTAGEVVLPNEMFEDANFEQRVVDRFEELDLDPAQYVVGSGIASLNPETGLEEFIFKKIGKAIKKGVKAIAKVAEPIANVAQFIPGPWQIPAATISRGFNVYNAVKSGNPLQGIMALSGAMPGGGRGFSVPGFGGGTFSFPGGGFAPTASGGGIGSLFGSIGEYIMPGKDGVGLIDNLGQTIFGSSPADVLTKAAQNNPAIDQAIQEGMGRGLGFEEILKELQRSGQISPYAGQNILGRAGEFILPGLDNQGLFTNVGQFLGGIGGGPQGQMMPVGGVPGGGVPGGGYGFMGGGGGGFPGGMLGAAGLAGLIGKLVYEDTKKMKGVPLTPLTQMNAAGRYNIEAEIARRTGQPPPNPVEFGLLPNNFPTLSGGQPIPAGQQFTPREILLAPNPNDINEPLPLPNYTVPQVISTQPQPVPAFMDGGAVYKSEGGDMDGEAFFVRMTGDIDGAGTEISDDIPAMLSDGEFVMTGRAVRGAGAFDMKNKNGVLTLTPSKEEDRDRGTDLMYEMMDVFSGRASPPVAAKGA